jgi:cytochrome c oxidase subunit IV
MPVNLWNNYIHSIVDIDRQSELSCTVRLARHVVKQLLRVVIPFQLYAVVFVVVTVIITATGRNVRIFRLLGPLRWTLICSGLLQSLVFVFF